MIRRPKQDVMLESGSDKDWEMPPSALPNVFAETAAEQAITAKLQAASPAKKSAKAAKPAKLVKPAKPAAKLARATSAKKKSTARR
jgi:hypothetical protein